MPLYVTVGSPVVATFAALLKGSDKIELRMYWYPNNLSSSIKSGDSTRLEFQAVSDTAESKPITIEVSWDGEWVKDRKEMQKHCIVREVSL